MNELLHKFKLGNDAELLLEKRGGGYEKVATVPIGSQALGVTQSAQGVVVDVAGTKRMLLESAGDSNVPLEMQVVIPGAAIPAPAGGLSVLHIHPATAGPQAGERWLFVPVGGERFFGVGISKKGRSNCAASVIASSIFKLAEFFWHTTALKTGTWVTSSAVTSSFSGSYAYSTTAGSTIEKTVSGTVVGAQLYFEPTKPGCAIVSIDGDYTAATRLPLFSAADLSAGRCRESDVGKRYVQCHASALRTEPIVFADKLSDGPHTIRIEATATRVAGSDVEMRVYVEGFFGVRSGLSVGSANTHFVPIKRVMDVDTWSEIAVLSYVATPAASTDFQFIGGVHGDGINSIETDLGMVVTVDGVDKTSAAAGSYWSGQRIVINHVTSRSHKTALATPIQHVRRLYIADARQADPIVQDARVSWITAAVLKEQYAGALFLGVKDLITKVTAQSMMSVQGGVTPLATGLFGDAEQYKATGAFGIATDGTYTAWVRLIYADVPRLRITADAGPSDTRYQDRSDLTGKLYVFGQSAPTTVCQGDVDRYVVGWGGA